MGCSCGGNKAKVNYEVTFNRGLVADGSKVVFVSLSEAQAAVRKNRGGMYKAVKATT